MSKAVERALEILLFIGKSEQHPTMSNICQELAIPKASASDLLHTLMDYEFIRVYDPNQMTLVLGERFLQLAGAYRRQIDPSQMIHGEIERFSDQTGWPIFFWIHRQNQMILMDRCLSRKGFCPNYEMGHAEVMEGVIGRVYKKGEEESECAANNFIRCYAEPVCDVNGKKAGVLSTYSLAGSKEQNEKDIFEALRDCAERIAKKISVEF